MKPKKTLQHVLCGRARLDEIRQETRAGVLPEPLLGRASIKVMETANKQGYAWEPMAKFLDPAKFKSGRCCGANEHLGCRCGAKWTARDYLKDAVAAGAELLIETECEEVLVEAGTAVGVRARSRNGERTAYRARRVILAAGGLATPLLLQRAGIDDAGDGCFMDPTVVVYGEAPFEGNWQDPPVSDGSAGGAAKLDCQTILALMARHVQKAFAETGVGASGGAAGGRVSRVRWARDPHSAFGARSRA